MYTFTHEGQAYTVSRRARFLVETANGTSSYTLERGFGCEPEAALRLYSELASGGNKKKRLTMIDGGKMVVIARTK